MMRMRLHYHKTGAMRYTGHLDLHKLWERGLRRARLPLAYSQGFHPQPRLNQACPLPLGLTSRAEWLEFWLEEDLAAEQVKAALITALPCGIQVQSCEIVDLCAAKIQGRVLSAAYHAEILDEVDIAGLKQKVTNLLASPSLPRSRRDKTYDLRPLVEALAVVEPGGGGRTALDMRLAARDAATGRPDEVLLALGLDPLAARIERTELIFADI
jgi:radical SAM-linked protein